MDGAVIPYENWYLSEDYRQHAQNTSVEVRTMPDGRTGLFALRDLPRKYVICYQPVAIRRKQLGASASPFTVDVLTKRWISSSAFVGDIPSNEHKDTMRPMWRGKPATGHFAKTASGGERCNAERSQLHCSPINEGELFYVPIKANRCIEKNSEILI